ncbi:response regulator transcription factor [Yersinia sp. 2553 StPb PI]|uniref:response regulator transcription factor n=1 Tax=Yersinia sp. 2553 StPb PI TaxID=3117411 RepID=UPI00187D1D75
MNYFILSQCGLMSFSFKILLNDVLYQHSEDSVIRVYRSIPSLIKNIDGKLKLILLDITGFKHSEVHDLLIKIKSSHNVGIILFCDNYSDLSNLPNIYHAVIYRKSNMPYIKKTIGTICHNRYDGHFIPLDDDNLVKNKLTKRENETLQCIISGLNSVQISKRLSLSYKTVSGYRRSICRKYGINNLNVYYLKYREESQ